MMLQYLSPMASPLPAFAEVARGPARFPSIQLWVAFVAGVAVALTGLCVYFCIKRGYFRRNKKNNASGCDQNSRQEKVELRRFRLAELEKATKSFGNECLLGSGAFGDVYEGIFDSEGTLAVKKPHADSYPSTQEFRNEVELLSRVKHRNLVGLVGYCDEADQKILVYEYVPHGSLLEYIAGRRRKTLTWRQRVNIAIGAAKGIAHLHEGVRPSIIHRDIKPSNILVGDRFEAKVSDFGLVKSGPVGDESHVSSQIKGTPGYLDPAYCSSFHLTPFSDVYSFGVILLQLVAARPAVDTSRPQSQCHIIDWARPSIEKGIVEEIVDGNLPLEACNMEMMLKMGQLGLRCVVDKPKDRPTMSQVVQELEEAVCSTSLSQNQLSRGPWRSKASEESNSFSIDGVGLQRFHLETDDLTIHSASMRCLDVDSISSDVVEKGELAGIYEEETDGICASTTTG
ncbi:probable serine/threonine-protein kinase PBL9 [Phoenix dactylifera]|uniref:non-specific serine/threonine protein kinase n=1 Tax=Phoenix dactylifera TaxID=42345 RepID=A0A8B8ZZK8_PHODC|nr:probable serine/threonine-protein kinase PBL9 [Phoenix dactylifera]